MTQLKSNSTKAILQERLSADGDFLKEVGSLLLSKPQIREFPFQTQLFANLIEGAINKDLKQRSRVVDIFPNQESCLRYACLQLMEIGMADRQTLYEDKQRESITT